MRSKLGIVGVGSFGEFMIKYLAPYFSVTLYDAIRDLSDISRRYNVDTGSLEEVAASDIVILSVPVQQIEDVLHAIRPHVKIGSLVIDVCSVKVRVVEALIAGLPSYVNIVSTHPLFGPVSGKEGINGLHVAVCKVRGAKASSVARFLRDALELRVVRTTPELHDREMAYVQTLTHLIAKAVVRSGGLQSAQMPTKTYQYLMQMVDNVRLDSDDLFNAIEFYNPYAEEVKQRFIDAVSELATKTIIGENA